MTEEPVYKDFKIVSEREWPAKKGGWGIVRLARNPKGEEVALKLFGYTEERPDEAAIAREISFMRILAGVHGVIELVDVFEDSEDGVVQNKNWRYLYPFPVIVMKVVQGGELFDRIHERDKNNLPVSEEYLAKLFKSAIESLKGIHDRRCVHRDLKMDNLMLASNIEDTDIIIIDFGCMVKLDETCDVYTSGGLEGTEGMYAPESVVDFKYSYKTDIWQAGCILYCMLSGRPAFHWSDEYRYLIPEGRYHAMAGKEWDGISASAKDLVAKLLKLNPNDRPTTDEILEHDWIKSVGGAEMLAPLGPEYRQRIKLLALRKSMANLFKQHVDIPVVHQQKKLRIERNLSQDSPVGTEMRRERSGSITFLTDKLKLLKEHLLSFLNSRSGGSGTPTTATATVGTKRARERAPSMIEFFCDEMNVTKYCEIMRSLNLDSLATPEYFKIFDAYPGDGVITMKELLFTLISFRAPQDDDPATLFFNLFCLKENNYIDLEELRAVATCLLQPTAIDSGVTDLSSDLLEALFDEIDSTTRDGKITLEEFKHFYNLCMSSSMSTAGTTAGLRANAYSEEDVNSTPVISLPVGKNDMLES